jgi:DNA (cytosine-5)-methyltransferase 1
MEDAIKLTVGEGLILQSFRPDYPVAGTKSKQWEQVGNAIPVLLARAILGELVDDAGP